MVSELVRIHHAAYEDDIPFWIDQMEGLDPILEIGCGHGRLTLPLIKAGHVLVGVDRDRKSLAYLKGALKELPSDLRQRVALVESDILSFHPEESFAGVIIPCNTFSTFNAWGRVKLLEKVHSCLNAGGLLVISFPNPHQMQEAADDLQGMDSDQPSDLETVIAHPKTGFPVQVSSRLRPSQKGLLWDWIYDHLHPNGTVERKVATVKHFLVSEQEIRAELDQVGFRDLRCWGDYSGEEYTESSPYLIMSCRT